MKHTSAVFAFTDRRTLTIKGNDKDEDGDVCEYDGDVNEYNTSPSKTMTMENDPN